MHYRFLLLVLVALIAPAPALAQDLPPVGSYSDDARAARISELKVKYRIALNEQERSRIIERCDTAKANISKLSVRVGASTEMRMATYEGVIATLASLRALVAARQVDASNLELLIVEYQRARTEFDIASTAYETALDDALVVDCRTDPDGFRASIEGIRDARKNTSATANAIDELTGSNLKTAFDTLKIRLSTEGVTSGI